MDILFSFDISGCISWMNSCVTSCTFCLVITLDTFKVINLQFWLFPTQMFYIWMNIPQFDEMNKL